MVNRRGCASGARSVLSALAVLLVSGVLLSGHAVPTGQQPTLAPVILASGLAVTAPGSVSLGSGAPGDTLSGRLGTVTVSGSGTLGWTATVSLSTPLAVTQGQQSWTFPPSGVRYWSGPATATSGGIGLTCLPGQLTAGLAQSLEATRTAFSCTLGVVGASSASWRPTLAVQTQQSDPSGTYAGTVTHSVS